MVVPIEFVTCLALVARADIAVLAEFYAVMVTAFVAAFAQYDTGVSRLAMLAGRWFACMHHCQSSSLLP